MDVNGVLDLLNNPLVGQARDHMVNAFIDYLLEKGLGRGANLIGRFFKRRFSDSGEEEMRTAVNRLDPVLSQIASGVRGAEDIGRLTPEQRDRQFEKPEVVAALHAAFDDAVETDDPLKQRILAELVVERLTASDESLLAISTRRAIESMRDLTAEHVRALALIELITVQLRENSKEEYRELLERFAGPLVETPVTEYTIRHLASLGLLDYEGPNQMFDLGTPPILNPTVAKYGLMVGEPLPRRIMERAHGDGKKGIRALQEIRLTPAGIITAITSLRELVGLNISTERFH